MPSRAADLTVETVVNASPEAVYGLLADLPTLAQLGEEIAEMRWVKGDSAQVGNVFHGENRNGRHRWVTKCTITDATAGRALAWDVSSLKQPVAHWRYDITPTADGGCRVVESWWDRRSRLLQATVHLVTGVRDRVGANAEHMRVTLDRLKVRAEADAQL